MIPAEFRQSGLKSYTAAGATWADAARAFREDEFILDPTRLTLFCGTAGYDGTQFKNLLADRVRDPAQQDLAQLGPAADQHQQHAQRRGATCSRCWSKSPRRSRSGSKSGGERGARRVRGAGEVAGGGRARPAELQPLPRRVSATTRRARRSKATCARRSTWPTTHDGCEHIKLMSPEIDKRLAVRTAAGLGELRHPLPARLPDHGARAR